MKLDSIGETFIKNQEQLVLHSYKDQVGIWTIGWGFIRSPHTGAPVQEGWTLTQEEAEQWWLLTIAPFEDTVSQSLRVVINNSVLTQNMFNACVSLCYNIGQEGFAGSTLVKYINNQINLNNITIQSPDILKQVQQYIKSGIAYWFLVWCNAGGQPNPDLVSRRKAEIKLYFS